MDAPPVQMPAWMVSPSKNDKQQQDDKKKQEPNPEEGGVTVDELKFKNLLNRREVYGDITQNATENELKRLLVCIFIVVIIKSLCQNVKLVAKNTRICFQQCFISFHLSSDCPQKPCAFRY